jgi:hypothetical protein
MGGDYPMLGWANDANFVFVSPEINMEILHSTLNTLSIKGTTVNLPALTYARRLKFPTNNTMTQLTLPSLVSASLGIAYCSALASVSLPSFTTFLYSDDLSEGTQGSYIKNNTSLTTLSLPALTDIDNSTIAIPTLDLSANAFPSTTVNYILHTLLTVTPAYRVTLNQTPPAPPTGQGVIDKQTLISQGNFIFTN